ncbi:MAG TPA: hypothetical protein VGG19_08865 [Tepidisphaeraceae bacterium]|jgi:hypothetical protein
MKSIIFIFALGLTASLAQGYVYSYQDNIAISAQSGEIDAIVPPGPDAPSDMYFVGTIATLVSIPSVIAGTTIYGNAAYVTSADSESVPPPLGVVIESNPQVWINVASLIPGDTIGPSSDWGAYGYVGGYTTMGRWQVGDPAFLNPDGSYVGIEFPDANDQIHYGWLLVRYDQPQGSYFGTIELLQAAYETDPGVPITIVPEPALSALAIAAVLMFGVRQRK